jgi:hypothetical protein
MNQFKGVCKSLIPKSSSSSSKIYKGHRIVDDYERIFISSNNYDIPTIAEKCLHPVVSSSNERKFQFNSDLCPIEHVMDNNNISFIIIDANHHYEEGDSLVLFRLASFFLYHQQTAMECIKKNKLLLFSIHTSEVSYADKQVQQNRPPLEENSIFYNNNNTCVNWHIKMLLLWGEVLVTDVSRQIMRSYIHALHDKGEFLKCLLIMKIDSFNSHHDQNNMKKTKKQSQLYEVYEGLKKCLIDIQEKECNVMNKKPSVLYAFFLSLVFLAISFFCC